MNMNDYRRAFNEINPRDGLKNEIISQCVEKSHITRFFNMRKLIPILVAAIVLTTGTVSVAVAAHADWFGKLFEKENVVLTEESSKLIAGVENFTCQSDKGILVSPVGVVADERTLYCVLSFDNLPSDINLKDMQVADFYSNVIPSLDDISSHTIEYLSCVYDYDFYDNNMICRITTDNNCFYNGDNITLSLGRFISETPSNSSLSAEIDATINFDADFGDMTTIEVDFTDIEFDSDFKAKNMRISPLNVTITESNIFSTQFAWNDIQITMNDGTVITTHCKGGGGDINGENVIWSIAEPINPDDIDTVYIGNLCLYTMQ